MTYHASLTVKSSLTQILTRLWEFMYVFFDTLRWQKAAFYDAIRVKDAIFEGPE
jgi:hypothetical protein